MLVNPVLHFPTVQEVYTNVILDVVQVRYEIVILLLVNKRFPLGLEELGLTTHVQLDSDRIPLHLVLNVLVDVLELACDLEVALQI